MKIGTLFQIMLNCTISKVAENMRTYDATDSLKIEALCKYRAMRAKSLGDSDAPRGA